MELAQIIARRLGLTGALGTVAESVDGHLHRPAGRRMLHGPAKAHAVRALAAREGLDLRRCTAYSDSVNDVPMLSVVGHAVAVNPDRDLRDVARERGWQIRDFRTGRKARQDRGARRCSGAGAVAGAGGGGPGAAGGSPPRPAGPPRPGYQPRNGVAPRRSSSR